jgi:hypothetical protein
MIWQLQIMLVFQKNKISTLINHKTVMLILKYSLLEVSVPFSSFLYFVYFVLRLRLSYLSQFHLFTCIFKQRFPYQ